MDQQGHLQKHAEQVLGIIQRSREPLTFTMIWRQADLAKSTISKYLKELEEQRYIDRVRDRKGQRAKYRPTTRGQQVDVARRQQDMRSLVKFYADLFVPETIIWQISSLVSTHLDAFLALPQSPDLYLALFYIYYNLTSTEGLFLRRREFCEVYGVKRISLDYHLDKVLSSNLGFYHFQYMGADYFFHENDELGTHLRRLVDMSLTQYLLQQQYRPLLDPPETTEKLVNAPPSTIFPLMEVTHHIVEELRKRDLVEDRIQEALAMFVERFIADRAIERGIPKEYLPEAGVSEPTFTPSQVEDIRGFCPRCGHWALRGAPICTRCKLPVGETKLLTDCVQAQKLTREYKAAMLTDTVKCPKCAHVYLRSWNLPRCPKCESEAMFLEK